MYGPRALISMAAVMVVFAVATYFGTASAATTVWQTLLCALILQVGYFFCLLFLVRREQKKNLENTADSPSVSRGAENLRGEDLRSNSVSKLKIGDR